MNNYLNIFSHLWSSRTLREKVTIFFVSIILSLWILFYFLLLPAIKGIGNDQQKIYEMKNQIEEMNKLSRMVSKSKLPSPNNPEEFKSFLFSSMDRRGFLKPSISNTDNLYHLEISSTSFQNLMSWLIDIKKSGNIFVTNAIITRNNDTNFVKVSLTLSEAE